MSKILVVEDDIKLLDTIKGWLEMDHQVEASVNGLDAYQLLKNSKFDLLIFDWNLPGMNGIDLCKLYRNDGGQAPVLFLTARQLLPDKAEGFEAGADDYLTKPFQMLELSLRVKALLRRPGGMVPDVMSVKGLVLDRGAVKVTKEGQEVFLSRTEFALLEYFLQHVGRLVTPEQIMESVWPVESERSGDALRSCLKKLRAKIDTEGVASRISNVHGVGYRFEE